MRVNIPRPDAAEQTDPPLVAHGHDPAIAVLIVVAGLLMLAAMFWSVLT